MTTFAFLHGSWLRGLHCRKVVAELERRDHRAVAPDLPSDDPTAGAAEYARTVVEAIGEDNEEVVVVGHSMSGLAVPLVAELRPVHRMVFVAAMFPRPHMSATESVPKGAGTEFFIQQMDKVIEHPDESTEWPVDAAVETLFDELPYGEAVEAASRLRPHQYTIWDEVSPLREWPECPSTYVVCADDRLVYPDWQRQVSRDLLGVEPAELPGGHYPFLARPGELCDLLTRLD